MNILARSVLEMYRFDPQAWRKARGVQLEGEAIFDVKHKNGKPFYVHTRHYDIRVLGTNFNVSSYAEEAEDIVTLKNGKVEIDVEGIVENAVYRK